MTETDNIGSAKLRSYAERIIRLTEEAEALASDISEVRKEAKLEGYNLKALNGAIRRARMTSEQRDEFESLQVEMDLYFDNIVGTGE